MGTRGVTFLDHPNQNHQDPFQPEGVTELLHEWADGDKAALDRVLPLVYDELRKVAQSQFSQVHAGEGLQATELVDMVYLRLLDSKKVRFESRKHFFWYASQMIRRFLVDRIREKMTAKRGAGQVEGLDSLGENITEDVNLQKPDAATLLALDMALTRLESINAQRCRIIEMRSFAGMTIDEIAEVLEVSSATVKREWSAAKRWLFFELSRH